MVRFLQQFETGKSDYTKERKDILESFDLKSIIKDIKQGKKK